MAFSFGRTDIGCLRATNEDVFALFDDLGLWVVCDGMGGYAAGEIAGRLAAQAIETAIREGDTLSSAIHRAHLAVCNAPQAGIGRPGMGATVVALRLCPGGYEVAWVGDSRAYLWDGRLRRLTRDHSLVQELVEAGVIHEEKARTHPRRNIVTQALGALSPAQIEPGHLYLAPPVRGSFLLCSDGLCSLVTDEEISAILEGAHSLPDRVNRLLEAARESGGDDNITVVMVGE